MLYDIFYGQMEIQLALFVEGMSLYTRMGR